VVFQPQTNCEPVVAHQGVRVANATTKDNYSDLYPVQVIRVGMENVKARIMTRGDPDTSGTRFFPLFNPVTLEGIHNL